MIDYSRRACRAGDGPAIERRSAESPGTARCSRPILGAKDQALLKTLLVIALVATLAVLAAGMFAMMRGGEFNKKYGNILMRARVAVQALAVAILLALFMFGGE